MDRFLYLSMAGAKQTQQLQKVTSNNLANINTPGFKRDQAIFSTYLSEEDASLNKTRIYSKFDQTVTDFSSANLNQTGNPLDVSIKGDGFLSLIGMNDQEAYTRTASLGVNEVGLLVDEQGREILSDQGQPIEIPRSESISIGKDGTVSFVPAGGVAADLQVAARIKLVNPNLNDVVKSEDGLFKMKTNVEAPLDQGTEIASGVLESSNVSAAAEMVNLIEASRLYEFQIKMMSVAKEISNDETQLGRLS